VVVQFVEGDPDRPIVIGSVYKAEQIPPYLLPDHAILSTLRSRSSKQGVAANFNELAFEDKKGDEYIRRKRPDQPGGGVSRTSSTGRPSSNPTMRRFQLFAAAKAPPVKVA
jgi:uncharacterized protein involved in type VI secretion and phage assembly